MTADWRTRAACRDHDLPGIFFPKADTGPGWEAVITEAKAVCARCPVRAHCLQWALGNRITDGIWGGLTETERRPRRDRRRTRAAA